MDAAVAAAGALLVSWLLFARNTVTRNEVSEMIRTETPLVIQGELVRIHDELVGLRADVSRLTGILEAQQKGR